MNKKKQHTFVHHFVELLQSNSEIQHHHQDGFVVLFA